MEYHLTTETFVLHPLFQGPPWISSNAALSDDLSVTRVIRLQCLRSWALHNPYDQYLTGHCRVFSNHTEFTGYTCYIYQPFTMGIQCGIHPYAPSLSTSITSILHISSWQYDLQLSNQQCQSS